MRIATSIPTTPPPPIVEGPYSTVNMLLKLPGVESVSYDSPARSRYTLNVIDAAHGAVLQAVLRDTIEGAKILINAPGELPDTGGRTPWWEKRLHMVHAISTLPGVYNYRFAGRTAVGIFTLNTDAAKAVERVVRDFLPDEFHTKVMVVVSKTGPENIVAANAESAGAA